MAWRGINYNSIEDASLADEPRELEALAEARLGDAGEPRGDSKEEPEERSPANALCIRLIPRPAADGLIRRQTRGKQLSSPRYREKYIPMQALTILLNALTSV